MKASLAKAGWGSIARTATLKVNDPECDLDIIPPARRDQQDTHPVSDTVGFGGINACIAMRAV